MGSKQSRNGVNNSLYHDEHWDENNNHHRTETRNIGVISLGSGNLTIVIMLSLLFDGLYPDNDT